MPSVYIARTPGSGDQPRLVRWRRFETRPAHRLAAQPAGLGEDGPYGLDDLFRLDQPEAPVVLLGADAPVAVLARHVVIEHAMGDLPRRMLRIGERVEVDDGGADRRGDVHR